jgi:hypothetical protein
MPRQDERMSECQDVVFIQTELVQHHSLQQSHAQKETDWGGHFIFPMVYKISRLLVKCNIKRVHIPAKKSSHVGRPVKDDSGLRVFEVYSIPYACRKVYTGQTGRSIETRYKEHDQQLHVYQLDKSTVTDHSTESGHWIKFQETVVLAKTSNYMDQLVKGATEIQLHPNNVNRDKGFEFEFEFIHIL